MNNSPCISNQMQVYHQSWFRLFWTSEDNRITISQLDHIALSSFTSLKLNSPLSNHNPSHRRLQRWTVYCSHFGRLYATHLAVLSKNVALRLEWKKTWQMFKAKMTCVDQCIFHLLPSQHPLHVKQFVSPMLQVCAVIWIEWYLFILVCHLSFTSGQPKIFLFISEVQEFGDEGRRSVRLLPVVHSFQGDGGGEVIVTQDLWYKLSTKILQYHDLLPVPAHSIS